MRRGIGSRRASALCRGYMPVVFVVVMLTTIFVVNERFVFRSKSSNRLSEEDSMKPDRVVADPHDTASANSVDASADHSTPRDNAAETPKHAGDGDGSGRRNPSDSSLPSIGSNDDADESDSDSSDGSEIADGVTEAGNRNNSKVVSRPFRRPLAYPVPNTCPSWRFSSPPLRRPSNGDFSGDDLVDQQMDEDRFGSPWLIPEPNTIVHVERQRCSLPLHRVIRVVFGGFGAQQEAADMLDWKEREAMLASLNREKDSLLEELEFQLRCRISGVTVELFSSEVVEGAAESSTATWILLHPIPSDVSQLHASHRVSVTKSTVLLWANSREGVAYAVSSLINVFFDHTDWSAEHWMQMPSINLLAGNSTASSSRFFCGGYDGVDGAVSGYRGVLVDVARHFVPISDLVRIVAVMSSFKLNALHLHLTDDQGWRLDMSDEFPELAEYGGRRGSNANPVNSKYNGIGIHDNVEGGPPQVYSRSDIEHLRSVARLLHVMIVPEVDVPAHSAALIRAAHASAKKQQSSNDATLLSRVSGVVEVHENCVESKTQRCIMEQNSSRKYCADELAVNCMGGTHGLLLPTNDTTLFLERLLHKLAVEWFPESAVLHIGGDETVQFPEAKVVSPTLKREFEQLWGTSVLSEAHQSLTRELKHYLRTAVDPPRSSAAWDDSMHALVSSPQASAGLVVDDGAAVPVVYWWRDWHPSAKWDSFRSQPIDKVLTPTTNTYFDASQRSNRNDDVFHVQDGQVEIHHVWELRKYMTSMDADRVVGVEGCLWSEMLVNTTVLWHQLFPRAAVLAQVGWTRPPTTEEAAADEKATFLERASYLGKLLERNMGRAVRFFVPTRN